MDFEKVFQIVVNDFNEEDVAYALIGGFAVGVWGIMRTTTDLDFIILLKDSPKIEKIMKKHSYRCVYKTENVSQYVSDMKIFGEIDFLHAFRKTSLSMLKRAKELPVFGGKFKVKVLIPEDIIGLKLQALVNNKERKLREFTDIEAIMDCFGKDLNWTLVGEYFFLFKQEAKFKKLKAKYGDAK